MLEDKPSVPAKELKPWYYQDWFLFPSFVFWPLWSILTIRSPWHNGFIAGALSWALIFMGVYLLVYQALILGDGIGVFDSELTLLGLVIKSNPMLTFLEDI